MKSNMDPLVSVVIPVCNIESHLHECVISVIRGCGRFLGDDHAAIPRL